MDFCLLMSKSTRAAARVNFPEAGGGSLSSIGEGKVGDFKEKEASNQYLNQVFSLDRLTEVSPVPQHRCVHSRANLSVN